MCSILLLWTTFVRSKECVTTCLTLSTRTPPALPLTTAKHMLQPHCRLISPSRKPFYYFLSFRLCVRPRYSRKLCSV
jgi:hypothetical protein